MYNGHQFVICAIIAGTACFYCRDKKEWVDDVRNVNISRMPKYEAEKLVEEMTFRDSASVLHEDFLRVPPFSI